MRAVKEGFCAIALEQRYMGVKGQTEEGEPSCYRHKTAMPTLLFGRTAIGERVWDISRLIDVIETHFAKYIDVKQIICMGNSGGGTATFYAACYEKRISMAIPSCAVCTYDDSIIAMKHCGCNYIPSIRRYFNMGDLGCLIAPRPLVVVCGKEDPIFPLHGVEASFEIIKKAYEKEKPIIVITNNPQNSYDNSGIPEIVLPNISEVTTNVTPDEVPRRDGPGGE